MKLLINRFTYLPSIFLCLINKFFNLQGIFLSHFRGSFTLKYSSKRIRGGGYMYVILLPFWTQFCVLVWTDIN